LDQKKEMTTHNLINHFPVLFPIAGFIVLLIGVFTRNELVKRTAYFLFVISAFTAYASMATGEGAEDELHALKNSTINHEIHEHEERAELFVWFMYGLGGISLLAMLASWSKKSIEKYLLWSIWALVLTIGYLGYDTGRSGGHIVHDVALKKGSQTE